MQYNIHRGYAYSYTMAVSSFADIYTQSPHIEVIQM